MKIKVALNQKSIKNALNALKTAEKQLKGEMLDEFYKRCYNYFVSRANYYLEVSGIGNFVIPKIQASWSYKKIAGGIRIINDDEKAVYIEFGVGIVGKENSHPNAEETNYKYNIPTASKRAGNFHDEDTWRFYVYSREEIDLVEGYYEEWETQSGSTKVITRGSPSIMYAFNALEDLKLKYKQIWQEVKVKYWG